MPSKKNVVKHLGSVKEGMASETHVIKKAFASYEVGDKADFHPSTAKALIAHGLLEGSSDEE